MSTPHINANKGDFAKVVLMPGDPLRAKWIAESFLNDVKLVTSVRGILGYTGYTSSKKRISVMASGMGMPSIGIYSNELFSEFDVETIIRIGTCGTYQKEIDVGDVILAEGSCTDSNWSSQFALNGGTYSAIASFDVLLSAYEASNKLNKKVHVGNILSADVFYDEDKEVWKRWAKLGLLGVEMESYALYTNAAKFKKKALCILTVSDSFLSDKILTSEQRQLGLKDMVEVAILTAEKFA
ncbi:MAG TPA: purine-nucleoside phosphorylase [Firmicutes bacterium]|nr:purine-nucleoside phosphorylase [Bacillota bacterium]